MRSSPGMEKILVVDDTASTLEVLQRTLASEGYTVFTAPSALEAIDFLKGTPVDLVITDFKMPKVSGIDLVRHIRENGKDTEVIMVTGFATVESAVQAVKAGAEEYLAKPFTDKELFEAVRRTLDKLKERRAATVPQRPVPPSLYGILGESAVIARVFGAIKKASSTLATVLVTGESGTGKELAARAIHYNSKRASAPFVPVNCGGIPEGLLESELFGYVKGAFTGAVESRAGFFQTAEGGTIFLDEISETSLAMQVKLLRVLQGKEVCMVGDSHLRHINIRIIAATNKDLRVLVEKGIFREDLFFRINVIGIEIPPLRERGNDIPLLVRHFSAKYAAEQGRPPPRSSDDALHLLRNYYWPGNVRELENVIQRIVVMSDEEIIEVPDLPSLMRFSALRGSGINRTLEEVEFEHIRNVLAGAGSNRTRAAHILGIDRKTLREKMKRYRLS